MRPDPRHTIFLLIALCSVAAASIGLRQSRSHHAVRLHQRLERDAATAKLENAMAIAREMSEAARQLAVDAPTDRAVIGQLATNADLTRLAEMNSLQARTLRSYEARGGADSTYRVIKMGTSGDLNSFYAFLTQLEQLPCVEQVTRLKLGHLSDHDGDVQAQLTFRMASSSDSKTPAGIPPTQTATIR